MSEAEILSQNSVDSVSFQWVIITFIGAGLLIGLIIAIIEWREAGIDVHSFLATILFSVLICVLILFGLVLSEYDDDLVRYCKELLKNNIRRSNL